MILEPPPPPHFRIFPWSGYDPWPHLLPRYDPLGPDPSPGNGIWPLPSPDSSLAMEMTSFPPFPDPLPSTGNDLCPSLPWLLPSHGNDLWPLPFPWIWPLTKPGSYTMTPSLTRQSKATKLPALIIGNKLNINIQWRGVIWESPFISKARKIFVPVHRVYGIYMGGSNKKIKRGVAASRD